MVKYIKAASDPQGVVSDIQAEYDLLSEAIGVLNASIAGMVATARAHDVEDAPYYGDGDEQLQERTLMADLNDIGQGINEVINNIYSVIDTYK